VIEHLQARIIDMHTVILGKHNQWVRLSLPWLARDIASLIDQIRTDEITESNTLDRIPALRFALAKLNVNQPSDETIHSVIEMPTISPVQYHRDSLIVKAGEAVPTKEDITYLCKPQDLLNIETIITQRQKGALLAIVCYSENAVMLGPILPTSAFCSLCFSYLAAPTFGLETRGGEDEKSMLNTALALAQSVRRQQNDTVIFDKKSLIISDFIPFIGCPTCITNY
jgi:hypothetical protein